MPAHILTILRAFAWWPMNHFVDPSTWFTTRDSSNDRNCYGTKCQSARLGRKMLSTREAGKSAQAKAAESKAHSIPRGHRNRVR
jgi:hypothetical protein